LQPRKLIHITNLLIRHGFCNKGISDLNFIDMIIETKKNFKDVDAKIHKLNVHKMGKSTSLPSLEVRKNNNNLGQTVNAAEVIKKKKIFMPESTMTFASNRLFSP